MRSNTSTLLFVVAVGCGGDDSDFEQTPDTPETPDTRCDTTTPWATAPDLLFGPAQELAAAAVGSTLVVLGGFQSMQVGNVVQVFDTVDCSWSAGPTLPKDIHHPNAAALNGIVYVVGGAQGGGSYTAIGDTWSWNPATEAAWSVRQPMPPGTERAASVAGVIEGSIYVAGGLRNAAAVTDVSYFDPIANTWYAALPLPQPRDHACGGVIGGRLYVIGGRNINPGAPFANVFELTPRVGWVERAPMPTARSGAACGVIGDRIIVAGGEGNTAAGSGGVFPQVEAYIPAANRWETLTPMPTPRHGAAAAVSNDRFHVIGGATQAGAGAVALHEILTP